MLAALLTLAAEEAEPSKTAFYVIGGALAGFAVVLTAVGMAKPDFPSSDGAARTTIGLAIVFVIAALVSVVVTS